MYFDQQMHACACIRMVENDQKDSKSVKSTFFHVYERLTRGLQEAYEQKRGKILVGQ